MSDASYLKVIKPHKGFFHLNLHELWQYRDLIRLFFKRNYATMYKQTILGPLWLLISPIISTAISSFVFGNVAKIPSEGLPYFLFYMCGHTIWTYFAYCLTTTSTTFISNAAIFGKVYFPRLVSPISTVLTGLLNLSVQFLLFLGFLGYFIARGSEAHVTWYALLFPLLVAQMAALGLGCGIIVSSLTTKYRDLNVLVGFGMSLWMYATPIIYSTSSLSNTLKHYVMLNPMASIIEIMRCAFLGTGAVPWSYWAISWGATLMILVFGIMLFNKVEKTFMDTV